MIAVTVMLDVSPALAALLTRLADKAGDVANALAAAEWNRRAERDRAQLDQAEASRTARRVAPAWVRLDCIKQRSGAAGVPRPGIERAAGGAPAPESPGTISGADGGLAPLWRDHAAGGVAAPDSPGTFPGAERVPAVCPPPQPPEVSAPGAAASGRASGRGWLTPERRAVLKRGWPRGVATADLRRELAALPGPPLPDNSGIATCASSLGLRRPPGFNGTRLQRPSDTQVEVVRSTVRPLLVEPRRPPPAPPPAATVKLPAALVQRDGAPSVAARMMADAEAQAAASPITLADLRQWARNNKVWPWDDEDAPALLRRVNTMRAHMGLPPWQLVPQRGPQAPLPGPGFGGRPEPGQPEDARP